jgi:molybdopterin molybdotransferase
MNLPGKANAASGVSGLVLAGGRGTRLGGRDKGWVELAGRPLIEYVLASLAPQVERLCINANRELERYQRYGLPVIEDTSLGQPGPLAGIAAGLSACPSDWLMVVPCDSPWLPADLVARLQAAALARQSPIAVVTLAGRLEPVFVLLAQRLAADCAAFLAAGGRKVSDWLARHDPVEVDFSDCAEAFVNLNTEHDLAGAEVAARRRLAARVLPDWVGNAPVIGVAAYSGTGKTTLLTAVLPRLKAAGLRVGMVKHAHHDFDIDHPGKDSYRLRKAGADQMVVGSSRRIAIMRELTDDAGLDAPAPTLESLLAGLDPQALDLVLVEGYKRSLIPRLVLERAAASGEDLPADEPGVVAFVTDTPGARTLPPGVPELDLNQPDAVAQFFIDWRRSRLLSPAPGVVATAAATAPAPAPAAASLAPASCVDDHDPAALDCETALARILATLSPLPGHEVVHLRAALGRVLVADLQAARPVPGFANSAVDGYAFNHADGALAIRAGLPLAGTSYAGRPWLEALPAGHCIRITTGAALPAGADSVVMQEHTREVAGQVVHDRPVHAGENVRLAGEDIAAGELALPAGRVLTPADLGILASLGLAEVRVRRRPRVAYFSTGDELRPLGSTLGPGQIHDSNRYTLHGMLASLPVETLDFGAIADDELVLSRSLAEAAAVADVVLTSGGVSVGDADLLKPIVARLGRAHFWKVAIKPGRPLLYGQIGKAAVFGLPGNPVAVMVTFREFVRPALAHLSGATPPPRRRFKAITTRPLRKRPGRTEYQRGFLEPSATGWQVTPTGDQGSHRLSSVSQANGYIILPTASSNPPAGSEVEVEFFD